MDYLIRTAYAPSSPDDLIPWRARAYDDSGELVETGFGSTEEQSIERVCAILTAKATGYTGKDYAYNDQTEELRPAESTERGHDPAAGHY